MIQKLGKRKIWGPVTLWFCLLIILLILPTGFEGALSYRNADRVKAKLAYSGSFIAPLTAITSGLLLLSR